MKVEKDFKELLELLNKNKVKYCIVGAYALAFYGKPRFTKDIDILVEATLGNGEKIVKALNDFGFKSLKLSAKDFVKKNTIIQLGYSPVRIDILTSIEGCSFDEIWKNKKRGGYDNEKVFFIGVKEFIKNKKNLNRLQDKVDLKNLQKIVRKKITYE